MLSGLKAQRRLAVYVALGLSSGGGLLFSAPSAYAAETHKYTETTASINGLEGTDKTGFMSDNEITLGREGGATDKPFSTYGTISGGGKKTAAEDVSNNTLTIHGLKVSNGGGQSMIYGGVSGTGAVTNNRVFFNNGLSKDPIYGGFNGASATKAVTGNSVTVAGGTVEGDVQGGGTEGTGAVTGNTVTLKGGTFGDEAMGGIIRNASSSAEISDNTVTMTGGTLTKANTKLLGAYTAGSGNVKNNHVILSDGTVGTSAGGNVYGGYAAGNGTVTGNTVAISGGTIGGSGGGNVYGGYSDGSGAVTGNTVTISGGTLGGQAVLTTAGKIYGGFSNGTGTTTGNRVNLGTEDGTYTAGTGMSRVQIFGGNRTSNTSDNALHVYAKNVAVEKISNFDTFNFHLTAPVAAGDTMLTMGTGSIGGTANWTKLTLDAAGWNNDKTKYGNIGNVILMHAGSGSDIVFSNYAAKTGTSGDFEYNITAQAGTLYPTRTQTQNVTAALNRFRNADATADNVTGTEVYGGYSSLGNTTTNNKIKITNTNNTNLNVYGGYTAGAGDSTNNHVTVSLDSRAKQIGKMVVGGTATASNSAIVGNSVTVEGGYVGQGAVGGLAQTSHTGSLKKNTFTLKGDGAVAMAFGALAQGGSGTVGGDSVDDGNHVVIEGGRAANGVYGGATMGSGKVSYNTVTISGGEIGNAGAYGGANVATGAGTVTHNSLTVAGGKIEGSVYGGFSQGTGTVTDNTVTINGGRFENASNIYGGYAHGNGTTTGNIVNLGDDTHHDLSGATLSESNIYGGNKAATGNTLNVNAKNIAAKSVNNFEHYKFHLNDDIAKNGGSMLTLTENNGFNGGNLFDWTKLDVDTSKLSGNTVIGNATLLTGTTNGLKFSNYVGRNKTTAATNGDYETALRTDTNAATATKVILDYNRFQNNANATYDGSISPTQLADGSTEVYGGISYAGNTTKNNHLTVTGVQGNLTSAYGGKTAGAKGDAVKNRVTVEQTGTGAISNVFGGYTSSTEATAKAEDNIATIKGGTFGAVYGGYVENAASATGNHVFIEGGTVQNAVVGGGGKSTATGAMSGNDVTITGGTVTGKIVGGDSRVLTSTSNKNIINLGDDAGKYAANLSGAEVWGTSYGGNVLANTDAKIAGNTLNVKVKDGVTLKKVRNVEKINFRLVDNTTKTAPLLNLTEAGGFGKVTADNSDVKVKWSNVTVDMLKVTTEKDAAKIQGKNTYILMQAADPTLKFSDYAARYDTYGGVYETGLRTNTNSDTAQEVLYDVNRFKDGRVTYTTASTGEALGGYSTFGNTTEGNELTLTGVTGTLTTAYGGQTAGAMGNSVNNKVTLNGTGAGSIANVYGGAITKAANSGNATGNTVTLAGGKVTGAVYGGFAAGNGKTTGNTVNLGADPTTLHQGDASALAAGTNFAAAELYGGNKVDAADNTLNVTMKDAAAKKAQNFDKYTFYLTNSVAANKPSSSTVDDTFTKSRGTMLTLAEGFDGQTADWNKVTVDTSKLSADKTLGAITLMKSTAANKLKFSNYAAKNHAVSGDYEVVQRTDTNTGEANAVLIDVNRFRNGEVVYDGGNPNAKTYAGVSYGGNTAKGNKFTLKGISEGKTLKYVSGGRSEGTAGGAVKNTVNLLGTGKGTLEEVYGGYVGNAANAADVTENTVNITGGTAKNVYGGYTSGTGKTVKNTVNIGYTDDKGVFHDVADGAKVTGTIYGGNRNADGNTLNVRGAITAGQIANFEHLNFAVNKDTAGKTLLTIGGGAKTTGLDWSKVTATVDPTNMTVSSYGASRVTLMANANGIDFGATYHGAKGETRDVFEFVTDKDDNSVYTDTYRFKGNEVSYAASDNTHDSAWSGRSELGNVVEENTLTMTGGEITGTAYGGTSRTNAAKKNTLVLRDGSAGELVGGFGTTATDNTVDIFGGTVRGDVYGGRATNGAASGNTVKLFGAVNISGVIHGGAGNTDSTNNTLAVRSFGTMAKDFANVQNLHFYLPAGTTSSETRTMLTLTNAPAVKDISTLNLGVAAVAADARAFRRGDAVSLLKVNGTLTTATELKNTGDAQTMKATQSGILDYTMRLEKRGENELIATVDRVDVNDRSKSPVETRVAASALLNAGADLLSNVGYTAAAEAAAVISAGSASAPSSAEGVRNTDAGLAAAGTAASAGANASAAVSGAFQPWAAQGGSSVRLNSGSYVDAKGWNLNVGFARTNEMKDAKLTYGPFVEYGRGTYDSYLDDGTHGDGSMHYIGGGVMAKMVQDSGLYVEGSLRAGRVSSDYTGSDDAAELSYDNASTYFAGHVGVGQEWKLANGNKIEGYAKYFYSHQAGDTVKLRSGGILEFGDVDSHRLRVGARYTHAVGGGGELYAGLAYEHEFGGDATATYQGYSTPSPSLGGGTGILELGYRFAPKDGRVSYGVNLMGMTGQREGIAGGAQVTWAF